MINREEPDNTQRFMRSFIIVGLVLQLIGLFFVYSASSAYALEKYGSVSYFLYRQFFFAGIGLCCALILSRLSFFWFERHALFLWLSALGFTALPVILKYRINGACRWISVAGFTLQPSEFLTIATLLYTASFLARHVRPNDRLFTPRYVPFFLILLVTAIVLLAQPDFGSMATITITIMFLFYLAGISTKDFYLAGTGLGIGLIFLIFSQKYRISRLIAFLHPWDDPKGRGFQIIQSLFAIGSGKLCGVGLGLSKQKFFYLPMQHTDFIFSIIAEEIGFLGVFLLISLFFLFFYSGLRLALSIKNQSVFYFFSGCLFLIALKTIINLFVCLGLLPTKGLGLPFISYGGSALIALWSMIGLSVAALLSEKE